MMHINIQHHADKSIVHLTGDFISEPEQDKFRSRIKEIVGAGHKELVIDLTGVHHINSCGFGALICALTTLKRTGGDLALAGIAPGLHELFRMTKLDTIFQIYPTAAEAASSLHAHAH